MCVYTYMYINIHTYREREGERERERERDSEKFCGPLNTALCFDYINGKKKKNYSPSTNKWYLFSAVERPIHRNHLPHHVFLLVLMYLVQP